MSIKHTEEFKQEAVRLALSSGLPRRRVAEDLGVGLSTLGKWGSQRRPDDRRAGPHDDLAVENERLCQLQHAKLRFDYFLFDTHLTSPEGLIVQAVDMMDNALRYPHTHSHNKSNRFVRLSRKVYALREYYINETGPDALGRRKIPAEPSGFRSPGRITLIFAPIFALCQFTSPCMEKVWKMHV